MDDLIGLFVGAVVASVVLHVLLAIIVALTAPKASEAPADDRERLIELKATRAAYWVLSLVAVTVALGMPFLSMDGPRWLDDTLTGTVVISANALLLGLVGAELVKAASQIVAFRRGV